MSPSTMIYNPLLQGGGREGGPASFAQVDGQQFAQRVVDRDVGGPSIGRGDGGIQGGVGVGQRSGTGVVGVRQGAPLHLLRRGFAAGGGAFETAGDGFVRLSHLFGRVGPAVAIFNAAARAHVFQSIPSDLEIRSLNLHQWCGMPCWRL